MTPDQINSAVAWVCTNQQIADWLLSLLLAHVGFSALSAILKWLGISSVDASKLGAIAINVIRALALDVHTRDAVVLKQADVAAEKRGLSVESAVSIAIANQPLPATKS